MFVQEAHAQKESGNETVKLSTRLPTQMLQNVRMLCRIRIITDSRSRNNMEIELGAKMEP
jgi:hypothetical protein